MTRSWWYGRGWLDWPTGPTPPGDALLAVGPGLTLPARADGPNGLGSPDDTLGGLVTPSWLAVDGDDLWLLEPGRRHVARLDRTTGLFRRRIDLGQAGGVGIAAGDGTLVVVEGDPGDASGGVVTVIATFGSAVRARLPLGDDARPVAVCFDGARFHVLGRDRRIYPLNHTHSAIDTVWTATGPPEPAGAGSPDRIVADRTGRLYLRWPAGPPDVTAADSATGTTADGSGPVTLTEIGPDGRYVGRFTGPEPLRDRFGPLPVTIGGGSRFSPGGADDTGARSWYDRSGRPVAAVSAEDPAGPAPYGRVGTWFSTTIDSATIGCVWDRIEIAYTLPPGGTIVVATAADDNDASPVAPPWPAPDRASTQPSASSRWSRSHVIRAANGPSGPSMGQRGTFAVLGSTGRHLRLAVELRGDGWATPTVTELRVFPQRQGLAQLLPSTYRMDPGAADGLRRFLALFATELDRVDDRIAELANLFSPTAVPSGLIAALAANLGVRIERSWPEKAQRILLAGATELIRGRGTPTAVQKWLNLHLRAATGLDIPAAIPAVIEGFRLRAVTLDAAGRVGPVRLPGPDEAVTRPRLGTPHGPDCLPLLPATDPLTDRFRAHANRFTVVVPRTLVPDAASLSQLERAVVAAKPAHCAHTIRVAEEYTVVGGWTMLGVSTLLGPRPAAVLGADGGDGAGADGQGLGTGLRLGGRPNRAVAQVGRGATADERTVLI